MKKIPFTSLSQDWRTPRTIFDGLNEEFHFAHDPCPSQSLIDGLSIEWRSPVFVNPPFSDISQWVEKAWLEYQQGKTVVLLIPSRTDTKWWHKYIMKASEIRFLQGRLKYEGNKSGPAPFPSCVVVFKENT